jgi:hypothetical protein
MNLCRWFLIAVATIILVAPHAAADETYALQPPKPTDAGGRTRYSGLSNDNRNFSVLDAGGKVLQSNLEKEIRTSVSTETILEKEKGQKPTKLNVTFEKASVKTDGKEEDAGLAGKTVTVLRKGKTCTFLYEDGSQPTDAALKFLQHAYKAGRESDSVAEVAFFPKMPVKIEETWPADLEEMARQAAEGETKMDFDLSKSKGTCRLAKVYTKEGRKFAVIAVDVEFALKSLGEATKALTFAPGSVFSISGTVESCISPGPALRTISLQMAVTATAKRTLPDGAEISIKVTAKGKETETHEELPAK